MIAILYMLVISSCQGLRLLHIESQTGTSEGSPGPVEKQWIKHGFRFREMQNQTLDEASLERMDKAQYDKCRFVEPLMSCMMKKYNWGMVWLHGLGDAKTENFYKGVLVPQILAVTGMPPGSGVSVFPQAPQKYLSSEKVVKPSWHNQETSSIDVNYKPPHHGHSLEDGLQNVPIVHKAIQGLMSLGIPASRIIVAGHSQGGSMGFLSAMQFPQRLLGAINLSGGMLGWWKSKELMHQANKGLPMLWIKGKNDQIMTQAHQDEVLPVLKEAGFPVKTAYFNGGHDLTNPAVVPKTASFINRQLAVHQYNAVAGMMKATGRPSLGGILGVAEEPEETGPAWTKDTLAAGYGPPPPAGGWPKGTIVTVSYTGEQMDGTVFRELKNYHIVLGMGNVIKCLDEGVATMTEGEEAMLMCPPETAYGKVGRPTSGIGPGETLIFYITVKSVQEK